MYFMSLLKAKRHAVNNIRPCRSSAYPFSVLFVALESSRCALLARLSSANRIHICFCKLPSCALHFTVPLTVGSLFIQSHVSSLEDPCKKNRYGAFVFGYWDVCAHMVGLVGFHHLIELYTQWNS